MQVRQIAEKLSLPSSSGPPVAAAASATALLSLAAPLNARKHHLPTISPNIPLAAVGGNRKTQKTAHMAKIRTAERLEEKVGSRSGSCSSHRPCCRREAEAEGRGRRDLPYRINGYHAGRGRVQKAGMYQEADEADHKTVFRRKEYFLFRDEEHKCVSQRDGK